MPTASATLINRDCFEAFKSLPDNSVDAVITDPPYFLDKLGDDWDVDNIKHATKGSAVTSLPVGMKFDPNQGRQFQEFMDRVSQEALRVLKPGGFYLAMSAPRLVHRLGVAIEDAGFEVRDLWAWIYTQNQVKAMSVERFLDKMDTAKLSKKQLEALREELAVWKTPQVKSCIEPIIFAQKPKVHPETGKAMTFLECWLEGRVGLVNIATGQGRDADMVTANLITTGPINDALDKAFLVPKPTKAEKGDTTHVSVKPLTLMDQMIRSVAPVGATIVDPFNGSGSTGISALRLGRNYIGFELSAEYYNQSQKRFVESFADENLTWVADGDQTVTARIEVDRLTHQSYSLAEGFGEAAAEL